nr:FAD-binding protein [Clostridia bacterium]
MNINQIYDELSLRIDKNKMILDAPMRDYTSFKAGGNAALLVQPANREELAFAVKTLSEKNVDHLVIGNGSNMLVKDTGYGGVVLRIGEAFQTIHINGDRMEAGAGVLLSAAAKEAAGESLTGFEFAAGIPGTIGGAVFMNAGAYDGEVSFIIEEAEVLSGDGTQINKLTKEELELSYRHSILQKTGGILL